MNLYEYQGKQLFAEHGIPVPKGQLLEGPGEVPGYPGGTVVKAQVLTGGRGKAGAIKVCKTAEEARQAAGELFAMKVKGHTVRRVLAEEAVAIANEYYFSIFINRTSRNISMMFSDKGGVEVEGLPPESLRIVEVNPLIGLQGYMLQKLLRPFGLHKDEALLELIEKAFALFTEKRLLLLEINPLARLEDGSLCALDAKVTMDGWALGEFAGENDGDEGGRTPFELAMAGYDITAVEMDGDIVVMGGGAGASMATADSLVQQGGSLRAIIDLGTLPSDSDDPEKVELSVTALRHLLTLNPKVIFFNYYFQAGRLDNEAKTLRKAFGEESRTLPIVLRCKGRMAKEGIEILQDTGFHITDSYEEGCRLALQLAKEHT